MILSMLVKYDFYDCTPSGDLITVRLQDFDDSASTQYEALSYFWGSDPADRPISLNNSHFLIKSNLEEVLRRLNKEQTDRVLWIDAICIYQDRYRTKCCRNLRFEPLFCEGFGFAYFRTRISVRLLEPERALTTLRL
jgi:hypothetical protein